ncbi:MAG TPA: hypothetical protein VNN09_10960 [Candidatus Competibacteraceae bacterium]|nr:hypothetical protein [Candidatus Competibacteraceae bacterium]
MQHLTPLSCLVAGLLLGTSPAFGVQPSPLPDSPVATSAGILRAAGLLSDESNDLSRHLLKTKAGHGGPCQGLGKKNPCQSGNPIKGGKPGNGGKPHKPGR